MLDPNKTEIIIAGPGTGKTHALLDRIEQSLLEGISPAEIAFFSFSTTAVNEGLERIIKRMKYTKKQFRYFKTLHAMAFSLLGLDTKQIISLSLMHKFAKENELKLGTVDFKTGIQRYQTKDSILLSQIDSARLLGLSIREYFVKNHIDTETIAKAEDVAAKYAKFKMANGVIDFTDMLLYANETVESTPHFRYMYIDEAQDLSTQQWHFVEKMADNTDNIVIVGDERQAIAGFAGADVDYFLKIKGKITELNRSYRVPQRVWYLARRIENKMIKTRRSTWYPRENVDGHRGSVVRITDLPLRDMRQGSWLLLTRTNAQLTEFKDYMLQNCDKLPAFFTVDGQPPVDLDVFKAIKLFKTITGTKGMTRYDFIMPDEKDTEEKTRQKIKFIGILKKFMTSKAPRTAELDNIFMHRFNYKTWFDAFDKVPLLEKRYINAVYKVFEQHPDAFNKAKIKLSTIHSAKGMEADNVILYLMLSNRVYKDWQYYCDVDDTELKVLFVGVTRARYKLYLLGNKKIKHSYEDILKW